MNDALNEGQMGNPRTLIEAIEIDKFFSKGGSRVEVLRGVSVKIQERESVSIRGFSGAGKSTLLHVLGTLEPPTRGRILYQGRDLGRLSASDLARFRNRELGFVFQFHYLLQEFTALENVLMPALIAGENSTNMEKSRQRAVALLTEVGLGHRIDHRPGELSGGEQQRVAIARALMMKPRILLADEPTGNLDRANAAMVRDLLQDINKNHGVTLVLVTHDMDLAAAFPRQIVMEDGKIVNQ